jgi:hypothetical protein
MPAVILALGIVMISTHADVGEGQTTGNAIPSSPRAIELRDLNGGLVRPMANTNFVAQVFIFISNDCPISNRCAPEIRRLFEDYRHKGVSFWLVHPLTDETPEAIRQHAKDYDLPEMILRDTHRSLTQWTGVRVTPEAAVVDANFRLVYRGRINDLFPQLGRQRAAITRHDLRDAIEAVLAGEAPDPSRTPAVGCTIPHEDP